MKEKTIIINGQFAARRMTGQERFAYELMLALDKIVGEDCNIRLVVPTNAFNVPILKNIKVVRFGKAKGSAWEQIFLALYSLLHRGTTVNLCTCMPLLKPGIICIHDLCSKEKPEYYNTLYSKVSRIWHLLIFRWAWWFSPIILTVSEYSKKRIIDIYQINPNRIKVISNGWEHFIKIKENDKIKYNNINYFSKPYFFALGSHDPRKNIEWIINVARNHPQYNFLIAGNIDLKVYNKDYRDYELPNLFFLGYVSDGEVKYLMKHCRAFLFPSFFEGFGIPPLEALSLGTKIVVSNATCLPEIFGDAAYFINPLNSNVDLDEILSKKIGKPDNVLQKYTYKHSAELLVDIFKEIRNNDC